jgi:hypothetical protein
VTGNKRYNVGANKIATRFLEKVKQDGTFLADTYRQKVKTIATSWVVLALLDYSRIKTEEIYHSIAFQAMDEILAHQMTRAADIYNYGRFRDTVASSGNGWINEVLVEVYKRCREQERDGCGKYKDALIRTTRWLIQNTYSEENTYHIKNPARALGGFIRNYTEEAVRTDAVCHGANSLIGLLEITDEGVLLAVPERPFEEILNQLKGP